MASLPILNNVVSCDGCGVCCMHMGTPPFADDEVSLLPQGVFDSLQAIRETSRVQYLVHGTNYTPCGWFNMETRQCRHHEHRPRVCRDFAIGAEYCINLRRDAGLERKNEMADKIGRAPIQSTDDLLRECMEYERDKFMVENANNEPTQSIEDAIRECDAHADSYNRHNKIVDLIKDLPVDDKQNIFDIIIQILGDPAKGVTMPSAGTETVSIPQLKVVSKPVVTVQSVVEIIEKIGSKTTAELKDMQRKFIDRGDIRSASLTEYRFSGFSDFKAALLEALAEIK